MGLLGRLFGKKSPPSQPQEVKKPSEAAATETPQLEANDAPEAVGENRLSLQVLYPKIPTMEGDSFIKALVRLHPSMAGAELEAQNIAGAGHGMLSWGPHRIEIHIRKRPLPEDVARRCIAPAHYRAEQKEQAMAHQAYVVLYHEAGSVSLWDQYAALGAAAAALSRQQGAVAVTNAFAFTSAPTTLFDQLFKSTEAWTMLQTMPPAMLYCGFIKYPVPNSTKVWMRTHGAHMLGVPDFALLADNFQQGEKAFNLFNAVINHLRSSGSKLAAGQSLQVTPELVLKFRAPAPYEIVLESPGTLLVIEPQAAAPPPAIVTTA